MTKHQMLSDYLMLAKISAKRISVHKWKSIRFIILSAWYSRYIIYNSIA